MFKDWKHYLLILLLGLPGLSTGAIDQVVLTEQERAWLVEHPVIRLAPAPNYPPIEFFDEHGRYQGVTADFVALIEQRVGIKFDIVRLDSWADVLERTRNREIDAWGEAAQTPARERYMRFTEPYIKFPSVILTRKENARRLTFNTLSGLKVVGISGYATHDYLLEYFPGIELISVPDIETGLKMVSFGVADAIVASAPPATYYIQKNGLTNLMMAGESGFMWELAFASRSDWPLLNSILQKGLDSITPKEREAIFQRWFELDEGWVISARSFWLGLLAIIAAAALMLTATLIWNTSLRRLVRERTAQLKRELDERERVEEAVRQSEERLARFFEASQEGLFFHDGGMVLDVNPATTQIFGYLPDELVGHHLLDFVSPDTRAQIASNMAAGDEGPYEAPIVTKDGAIIPAEARAKTIEFNGTTLRVVSLQDVSERKRAQLALQKAHHELEDKVAERTRELEEANTQLRQLDRLKSLFIASMSHELRTPLNSIIGFTGVILQGMSGEVNERQQDQLTRVYGAAKHLLALISDVIDISKIEAGKIDVFAEAFDLAELINEAVEQVSAQAQDKGLNLEVEIPPAIELITDRKRVLQCVLNYLSNAVKYTEKGDICIKAQEQGDDVEVTVSDTGIGIAKDAMPKLFLPFERIDSHLRIQTPGTGLGLYLTHKLATELLHGTVSAVSQPGRGSTFVLRIPKQLGNATSVQVTEQRVQLQ